MTEHDELIAVLAFFIIIFAALLVVNSADKLTGMAVLETKENVQAQVQQLANKLDFLNSVAEANMCLLIKMDAATTYSYKIEKLGSVIDVKPATELYCDGLDNEDFVFSYISYDAFLQHVNGNPTFENFKATGDGTNFYVLPSKYIEKGMTVKNTAEFETKFGTIFNKFSAAEKTQFLTVPTAPQERGVTAAFPMSYIYFGSIFILAVIVLVLLLPKLMKKPAIDETLQLVTYVKSALAKGYTEENIKESLIGSGWKEEAINNAIAAAKPQEEAQPQEAAQP